MANEWTDDELAAAIDAYLKMLQQESLGQPYSKADYRSSLRGGPLSTRSDSSIEYRMQNISAVLEGMGYARIAGYMPAKNVGAGVAARVGNMLRDRFDIAADTTEATDDDERLAQRVFRTRKAIRNGLIKAPPKGQELPKAVLTTCSAFVRDPAVKAWVLELAKGQCEGCEADAPFKTVGGEPYLEVHHVKPLAAGGSDRTSNAVALCPNCHRRAHLSVDSQAFIQSLYGRIERIKPE